MMGSDWFWRTFWAMVLIGLVLGAAMVAGSGLALLVEATQTQALQATPEALDIGDPPLIERVGPEPLISIGDCYEGYLANGFPDMRWPEGECLMLRLPGDDVQLWRNEAGGFVTWRLCVEGECVKLEATP